MIAVMKSFIKAALSDLLSDSPSPIPAKNTDACSSAYRVGPQRVIFTANVSGLGGSVQLGDIVIGMELSRIFTKEKNEECVLVSVNRAATESPAGIFPFPMEKRVPLKIKNDTEWLSVRFVDGNDMVLKAERIPITS